MSNLKRLGRIIKSYTGSFSREVYYDYYDIRMILTELGLKMSPEALSFMTETDARMESFLQDIYTAEDALNRDIIVDSSRINSDLFPNVYEEDGQIIFTITKKGKEVIFSEVPYPGSTIKPRTKGKDSIKSSEIIDIPISDESE